MLCIGITLSSQRKLTLTIHDEPITSPLRGLGQEKHRR